MATLNEAQAGIAFRTAMGWLGANPGSTSVQIAREMPRLMGPAYADISYATWAAVARRTVGASNAGEAMNANPSEVIPASELNPIPGSTLYDERFQYRVIVVSTDQYGNEVRAVWEYRSTSAVSLDQIAADVASRAVAASGYQYTGGRRQIPGDFVGAPTVMILSAGKRGRG